MILGITEICGSCCELNSEVTIKQIKSSEIVSGYLNPNVNDSMEHSLNICSFCNPDNSETPSSGHSVLLKNPKRISHGF